MLTTTLFLFARLIRHADLGPWPQGRRAQVPLCSVTSRLILALGLVLGLLTFPTTCRCGAELPHEHVLFELPGHHHDGQSTASDSTTDDARDYDGPVLRASDGWAAIGQPVTVAVQLLASPLLRSLRSILPFTDVLPDGLVVTPDPPPPRQ